MTATHSITASQVKDIKAAFVTLKPQKVTLDGDRAMTVKEAIFALAPTLERMKKRGFDIPELVEKVSALIKKDEPAAPLESKAE